MSSEGVSFGGVPRRAIRDRAATVIIVTFQSKWHIVDIRLREAYNRLLPTAGMSRFPAPTHSGG